MSMISGLIDELNKSADEWNASNMFELARMCREAADTIDRLDAENVKLREENQSIGLAAYELGRKSMAGESDKLRELLDYVTPIAWYAASERERDRMRELGVEVA